jgi:hypothetical protein
MPGGPLDQPYLSILYFQSGDVAGVDATASVKVGGRSIRGARWAVRMATNDHLPVGPRPLDDSPLGLVWLSDTPLPARDPRKIYKLQAFPDGPHHESAHHIQPVTREICLMPVNHKDTLPGLGVPQDKPLLGNDPIFFHRVAPSTLDIMVAYNQVEPILLVELVQQVKDALVRLTDAVELPVLPQLIAVSNFNIREPLVVIVGQRVKEQPFVPGKGIGATFISSVTVTEQDNPAGIVKGNFGGGLKDLGQPPARHSTPNTLGHSVIPQWQRFLGESCTCDCHLSKLPF